MEWTRTGLRSGCEGAWGRHASDAACLSHAAVLQPELLCMVFLASIGTVCSCPPRERAL